ncbi:DUF3857 domain-containing protein [candidate division WOR-3 bacterium]|nr:DUF3857 domain-containing protein [candidate division WOR-3 bacterium]
MKYQRLIALVLIIAGLGCRSVVRTSHDVIYLTNGEEAIGSLERISEDSVWFKTEEGMLALPVEDVASIDLPQPREGEEWQKVKDINDPVLKQALEIAASIPPTDVRYINLYVEHDFILREDRTFEHRQRVIRYVTAESGKGQAANNTWFYLADRAHAKVDFARSVNPEGIVTHINEAAINRTSRFPAPAEYSNLMQIQIAVPESRVGSVLDFQFSTIQQVVDSVNPISHEIVLGGAEPTVTEIIRLEQPAGGPLKVYASDNSQPERQTRGNSEILTWIIQNQPPLRYERMIPPDADYLPHFIIAWQENWHDVAAHLQGPYILAIEPGERIPALVDSLTEGLESSMAKAQALYGFVATSIRNVGPYMDNYSYLPTPAEEVLVRRFANNLDRNMLLYALMLEAGLEADLVLLRTRSSGRLVPQFGTLGQLDYAMVLFEDEIFLDPVPDVPFGTLLEQDMMGVALSSGKLKEVPLRAPSKEQTVTSSQAELSKDGTLELTVDVSLSGKGSASWKGYLKSITPAEQRQQAEGLATSIHPNANLLSYQFEGADPLNEDVSYNLKMRVPDYATKAGDYLIFYMPGVEHSAYEVGATERLYPIDRLKLSSDVLNIKLTLPSGAELMYYPADVSITTDQDSYTATFTQPSGQILQFNEVAEVKEPLIPPQDYAPYKNLVEGMARLSQEPIVLRLR